MTAWARAKQGILVALVLFFLHHARLSFLIIRLTIALAWGLLASSPAIFQALLSSSRFCGYVLANSKACGTMPVRLPSVVGMGSVWRSATIFCLAVGQWVANVIVVVGRCDGNDSIVWAHLVTWGTNGSSWLTLPSTASLIAGALFAVRRVAVRVLIGVNIVDIGAIGRGACKMAARVF